MPNYANPFDPLAQQQQAAQPQNPFEGINLSDPFQQQVFGDILDPDKAVRNALRNQGINPMSADPRVRSMIRNASSLLMPVYGGLMNNYAAGPQAPNAPDLGHGFEKYSIDQLPQAINTQVQRALAGQNAYYSPSQGRGLLGQMLRHAQIGQAAQTGQYGVPAAALLDPTIQLITQLMGNDQAALGLLNASLLGGIAPRMQSVLARAFEQLPEQTEFLVARNPQAYPNNLASFLEILIPTVGNPYSTVGWDWRF